MTDPTGCNCPACKACERMLKLHNTLATEGRDPTDAEIEEQHKAMEDLIEHGRFYR